MVDEITYFVCEICNSQYEDYDDAIECEERCEITLKSANSTEKKNI